MKELLGSLKNNMKIYKLYFDQYCDYRDASRIIGYYSSIEKAASKIDEDAKQNIAPHQEYDIIIYNPKEPFEDRCYTLDGKKTSYTYFGYVIKEIEVE